MHVHDLIAHIERHAPPHLAASWDRCGIQVASRMESITRLAVTLDPTPDTVAQAVENRCHMLLAHHPISLNPGLPQQVDAYHDILRQALGAGLWIYSAHTSLDANPNGPAGWLATALGLRQVQVIEEIPHAAPTAHDKADGAAGFGQIGDLPQALSWEELCTRLTSHGLPCQRHAGTIPASITRVAICPGSGASLGQKAFARGAQVFITGDLKYHDAQVLAPLGLTVDASHFCLEEPMMRTWSHTLARELAPLGVQVHFVPGHDPIMTGN